MKMRFFLMARHLADEQDGWSSCVREDVVLSPDGSEASDCPCVCVCFEGGPGTIATVANHPRHGTAVLLMNGSGRVADLLSDCVRVAESERFSDEADEQNLQVERLETNPFDKTRTRKMLLIKRVITFMCEIFDLSLRSSVPLRPSTRDAATDANGSCGAGSAGSQPLGPILPHYTWPPSLPPGYDDAAIGGEWRAWGRRREGDRCVWVHGRWCDTGPEGCRWVPDVGDSRRVLEPGTAEHYACAVAVGRQLLDMYHVPAPNQSFKDAAVLQFLAGIFDAVRAGAAPLALSPPCRRSPQFRPPIRSSGVDVCAAFSARRAHNKSALNGA